MPANSYLLDSTAFLAFANREPGGERVQSVLRTSYVSAVSAAEVVCRLVSQGFTPAEAEKHLVQFVKEIVPFDTRQAVLAAGLVTQTRELGLAFCDRACLALARQLGVPVLTANVEWAKLDIGVVVEVIRPAPPPQ